MLLIIKPAARWLDLIICTAGLCTPGLITFCWNWDVFIDGRPAAAVGDECTNCITGFGACFVKGDALLTGSLNTFIGFRPAARVLDLCQRGVVVTGSLDTFIGD